MSWSIFDIETVNRWRLIFSTLKLSIIGDGSSGFEPAPLGEHPPDGSALPEEPENNETKKRHLFGSTKQKWIHWKTKAAGKEDSSVDENERVSFTDKNLKYKDFLDLFLFAMPFKLLTYHPVYDEGLNARPLGSESSAVTNKPWLQIRL